MSSALIHFAGDPRHARHALGRIGAPKVHVEIERGSLGLDWQLWSRLRENELLALLGEPPADEIGYWLAPAMAAATAPSRVAVIDAITQRVTLSSRARYLSEALPFAACQIAASTLALCLQHGVARAITTPGRRKLHVSRPARRAVYLRAAVGSGVSVGGSITHSHEVIRALGECGVAVEPVTTDRWIAETARRRARQNIKWRVARDPRLLRAIPASAALGGDGALVCAAWSAARSADFIYQRHARFSLCGAILARVTGLPLFLEYNGSEVWVQEHWQRPLLATLLRQCEDASLASADRIVVVSHAGRRELEARGVAASRILINPNGVDPGRFAQGGGPAVRRTLSIHGEAMVYGFVGTFGPWHGVPQLAEAFIRVAEGDPEARLLLVGDGDERRRVQDRLDHSPCRDRVTFVGRVEPEDVSAHLDACDILVSPHVWKPGTGEFFGSPTKLFEYMASSKPIVASRLGQIAEVLADGVNALLVPPGDVSALADAMVRLRSDSELRVRLGERARRDAATNHSWALNARRILDSYEELLSAPDRADHCFAPRS